MLEDGLGDTIRVSLTEDPVREVPVARGIARRADASAAAMMGRSEPIKVTSPPVPDYFDWVRRGTSAADWTGLSLGGEDPVRVELDVPGLGDSPAATAARLATDLSGLREVACESLLVTGSDAAAVDDFRSELSMLGVDLPISLRVVGGPRALEVACRVEGPIGRWVVPLLTATDSSEIAQVCDAAERAGVLIEWE